MLVPGRVDGAWFHALLEHMTDMLIIRGRIKFEGTAGDGPPFGTIIFGLNISLEPLSDLGTLLRR